MSEEKVFDMFVKITCKDTDRFHQLYHRTKAVSFNQALQDTKFFFISLLRSCLNDTGFFVLPLKEVQVLQNRGDLYSSCCPGKEAEEYLVLNTDNVISIEIFEVRKE